MCRSFAAGLGPIPFVLTAQIAPYHAVSTLSSIALSVQCPSPLSVLPTSTDVGDVGIMNGLVAVAFLPLRHALGGERGGEGNVFGVFVGVLVICGLALARLYKE